MNSLALISAVASDHPPSTPRPPVTDAAAVVADIIRRLSDGAGIILNPSLLRRFDAAPMDITPNQNLSSLLGTAIAQSNLGQLPADALGKPQVIEATVLGNSPLLQSGADGRADQAVRISVLWQGRTLQLLGATALPVGARLRLAIDARGEVSLLAMLSAAPAPRVLPGDLSRPMLALQMALRENLAQAQPLQALVPLLQRLGAAGGLPEPLARAINQLLHNLPGLEQLRNPAALKQALTGSGTLLEARLATADAQAGAQIAAGDLKAQIVQLLALLRKLGFAAPDPARAPLSPNDDLVYSARPAQHGGNPTPARAEGNDATEALLNQLGKLLSGGLARIQLNQLDAAGARHLAGADNSQPVPTWVFELPLQGQRGADGLHVRIEQHRQQREGRQRSQWTVNIGFDLHELGKLAATLTIVERSVAATLWSEREAMHRAVRTEVEHLRTGLEQAGVKVTEVQCRLGLPPARGTPLSQQLVDVLT